MYNMFDRLFDISKTSGTIDINKIAKSLIIKRDSLNNNTDINGIAKSLIIKRDSLNNHTDSDVKEKTTNDLETFDDLIRTFISVRDDNTTPRTANQHEHQHDHQDEQPDQNIKEILPEKNTGDELGFNDSLTNSLNISDLFRFFSNPDKDTDHNIRILFNLIDTNNDQLLDSDELNNIVKSYNDHTQDATISYYGKETRDNKMDINEFKEWIEDNIFELQLNNIDCDLITKMIAFIKSHDTGEFTHDICQCDSVSTRTSCEDNSSGYTSDSYDFDLINIQNEIPDHDNISIIDEEYILGKHPDNNIFTILPNPEMIEGIGCGRCRECINCNDWEPNMSWCKCRDDHPLRNDGIYNKWYNQLKRKIYIIDLQNTL